MSQSELHPQAVAHLQRLAAAGLPQLQDMTPEQARAMGEAASPLLTGPLPDGVEISEHRAPGAEGDITVRRYRVEGAISPAPALVWFHGGGWVVGSLDTYEVLCAHLALAGGCTVLSVDYRLAPEHPFPAAVEDCLAAARWVSGTAELLDVDRRRLALGGDSAGGNLATVVARHLKHLDPPFVGQLLVYPATEMGVENESTRAYGQDHYLTVDGMRWFGDQYAPDPADRLSPDASPLRADDLEGSPPAHILVASHDPLRDEGIAYAEQLTAQGVPAELRVVEGHLHGFLRWQAVIDAAGTEILALGEVLRSWWQRG
jgi:acetyl esterase